VNDIKKLRFLLKKGFYLRILSDKLMTLSLAIMILKIYAVHEVSEKKQINNKLMSKQKLLTRRRTTNC
jgi:hypothetical protein